MSEHPNMTVINRMTQAVFESDRQALAEIFTENYVLHMRGPLPRPSDHSGVDGFLDALGAVFDLTDGDVKIQQLHCTADDQWGVEWEYAVLGRNGHTLTMNNAFAYRFEDGRIAEMWFISAAPAEAASFWA